MARVVSKPKRAFILFLMLVMLMTGFGSVGSASAASEHQDKTANGSMHRTDLSDIADELTSTTYSEYLKINSYSESLNATQTIKLALESASKQTDDSLISFVEDFGNESNDELRDALVVGDSGGFTIEFEVTQSAFYSLDIEYYTGSVYIYSSKECVDGKHELICSSTEPDDYNFSGDESVCEQCGAALTSAYSKNSAIERKLFIDDAIPYKEARSIEFQRYWIDVYSSNGKTYYSNEDMFNNKVSSGKLSDRVFPTDSNNNEKKPEKEMYDKWVETKFYDSTGYASDPLMFYLEEGIHTITLEAIREPVAISALSFVPVEVVRSYQQYLEDIKNEYGDKAKDVSKGTEITIQAEHSYATSSNTIYQTSDRASCLTEPQDVSLTKLNEIGGDKWQYVGQWIEWQVTVEETGFYKIVPRSIQDFYSGVYVSRKIYINGELPFAEAANLRFNYSDSWQTNTLTDGDTDFKFFFEGGQTYIIRFEVVLGKMAEVLNQVETSLNNINSYYRSILMITGPDPDEYRDYGFEKILPEVVRGLRVEAKNLKNISASLSEIIGYTGDHSVTLDKVAQTVEQMGNNPSKIANLMDDLKSQSGSLGTWLTDTQKQPLNIDYIKFMAPDDENPEAEAGFFRELWQEIKKFIMSFFTDYTSISGSSDKNAIEADDAHTIEVWVTTGRDQASILRNLVDDSFTELYPGIDVRVKLVAAGTLLPSTLAGTGPDVSLGNAQTEAINYAIRSAVMALNTTNSSNGYNFNDFTKYENDKTYSNYYKDADGNTLYLDENGNETTTDTGRLAWRVDYFDELKSRFADEAMKPLTIYGETYGIPENMSFYMMFYRKDILTELGLSVPDTWDEFYQMIYTLQSNKLEIGFPTGVTGSTILMYQQGETMYDEGNYDAYMEKYGDELRKSGNTYYDEELGKEVPKTDGMTINLDSDIALACFKEVCQFFTMYDFPVSYDFANRFRSGEMPIAIADYTAYNQLIVFAPEINGMWEFTPLPGTMDKDGVINNTTVGTVTSMMMMRSVKERGNEFAAYVFMQWWSDKEAQSTYGTEMEALLGPSAKQNTANKDALYDMPWSNDEFQNLSSQFNDVTCTPEYPGGYIIARYANFAFLDVYNNDAEPVEELLSNITYINAELSRKREEFDLPTAENYPLDED